MILYGGLLLLTLLAMFSCMNSRFMSIDSCLDFGGVWDYSNNICSDECIQSGNKWDVETSVCITGSENN